MGPCEVDFDVAENNREIRRAEHLRQALEYQEYLRLRAIAREEAVRKDAEQLAEVRKQAARHELMVKVLSFHRFLVSIGSHREADIYLAENHTLQYEVYLWHLRRKSPYFPHN